MANHSINGRRALLLFVRDEHRESAIKPLPGRYRREGYAALNRRIIARLGTLIGNGVDLVIARETPAGHHDLAGTVLQRGSGFGERLANAIDDTFALGYDAVVAVGNDCPTLSPDDVATAFDHLAYDAPLVAAPSRDGGAYLVGARTTGFDRDRFISLPWQTGHLFTALLSLGGVAAIATLRDDFDSWESRAAGSALELLFPDRVSHAATALPPSRTPVARLRKALTRSFLPAPPLA